MLAQWGQFLLSAALALSCWQVMAAALGARAGARATAYSNARVTAALQFAFVLGCFTLLAALMLIGDYTVDYVAAHTNDALPAHYRLAATWSAHEGSMLLWMLMLSGSALLSVRGADRLGQRFACINLMALGLVSAGVAAFVLFSSNPLDQTIPPPAQGADLNPLLQDPGLIFHPPLLYVGYVSTVVVFAATVAALVCNRLDREWAVWLRPYALFSWVFLSLGIALGSYWAYYELGWGGWWFWDPVENASFMPWLALTALVHSLAVASRTGALLPWCALLAIAAFALSMLGAFLVRSGALVSVHSFAADPQRGIAILALLFAFVAPALALFAQRARLGGPPVRLLSAAGAILANNVFLCVAAATVFLGTLYPLALEVISAERISVGAPYFNAVFVPLMLPLLLLAPLAGLLSWRGQGLRPLLAQLTRPALAWLALMAALLVWAALAGAAAITALAASVFGLWTLVGTAYSYASLYRQERMPTAPWRRRAARIRLGQHGMHLAHLGLGVFALAVALVSTLGQSVETAMAPGDSHRLGRYSFTLNSVDERQGLNYEATYGIVDVMRGGEPLARLRPERRRYHSMPDNEMTEAAISSHWFGDVFVALSGQRQDSWGMRLQVKPAIQWIWLGVLMMACGGALAIAGQLRARRR